MTNRIVSFENFQQNLYQKAFNWAVQEQKRMGCMAQPIAVDFDSDCLDHEEDNCVVSVFIDHESGKTLMRHDWLDDMGIKYSLLVNFDEIKNVAPKSARHMLENGIKIYRYYDGPNGGITRRVNKEWI